MKALAKVVITPKAAVKDPQGLAIRHGLETLGFSEVRSVRAGKYLEIEIESGSLAEAEERLESMCQRLLANQVIEDFRFEVLPQR